MKKKIISFKCQKKIYYFFIFWISELIIIICDNYFPTEYLKIEMKYNNLDFKHAKLENIKINQLTLAICRIISKLLAGIGILCNFEITIDNISENKTKFFLLIIISILLFLFKFLNFIYHLITKCMEKMNDYVMDWVIATFPTYRKEMKGIEWGLLYNDYGDNDYNVADLEAKITKLMADDDVSRKAGIYEYVIDGQEKHLSIRAFTPSMKRSAYTRQQGICAHCHNHFTIDEMEADHITPWHLGGTTTADNCQMLCKDCNRRKSGH
jgi:hypothetical protein